jgi:hypothetical protein
MKLVVIMLKGRPRNGWQGEVREVRSPFGGRGWKERICNGKE